MTQSLALRQLSCDKILKTNWSNTPQLTQRWKPNVSLRYIAFDGVDTTQETQCFKSLCEPAFSLKNHTEENICGKVSIHFCSIFCTA